MGTKTTTRHTHVSDIKLCVCVRIASVQVSLKWTEKMCALNKIAEAITHRDYCCCCCCLLLKKMDKKNTHGEIQRERGEFS